MWLQIAKKFGKNGKGIQQLRFWMRPRKIAKAFAPAAVVLVQLAMPAVGQIVEDGLKHRGLEDIESIGVDEIQYPSRHKYLTHIYQIDGSNKRLLRIGKDPTEQTMERFFDEFNREPADGIPRSEIIQWICSDKTLQTTLFQTLGRLPEPALTHRFC